MKNNIDLIPTYHLYIDDSGSRMLDKDENKKGSEWFALGGILIEESKKESIKNNHTILCKKWNITKPLHSYEIRNKNKNFYWLNKLEDAKLSEFHTDLENFILNGDYVAIACVISRSGYNLRYKERYGKERWKLNKTAFPIIIERAVKYVKKRNGRLKVYFEKADPVTDEEMNQLFKSLRENGMPFDKENSEQYCPLNQDDFKRILWECRPKLKDSKVMQLADLVLFPICVVKYSSEYKPWKSLHSSNKLIDCHLEKEQIKFEGIKYSCF